MGTALICTSLVTFKSGRDPGETDRPMGEAARATPDIMLNAQENMQLVFGTKQTRRVISSTR